MFKYLTGFIFQNKKSPPQADGILRTLLKKSLAKPGPAAQSLVFTRNSWDKYKNGQGESSILGYLNRLKMSPMNVNENIHRKPDNIKKCIRPLENRE